MTSRQALPSITLTEPPTDTVSCLEWYPVTNNNQSFLAAGSWDNTVRVWDVNANLASQLPVAQPKALFKLASPVLSCAWSRAGAVFAGECRNGTVTMLNLQTQQQQQVGKHDGPVSGVAFSEEKQILVTSSWDCTLRFWDLRQPTPVLQKQLNGKIHGMGLKNNVLCATCTDKNIYIFNMNDPNAAPVLHQSPLRMPANFLAVAKDGRACIVGSSEGRACIFFLTTPPPMHNKPNFPFKCCRVEVSETNKVKTTKVFPVNAAAFHPVEQTVVATAGGSGSYTTWDYAQKARIWDCPQFPAPVTAINFDDAGKYFAYALGYDWHQGCHNADAGKWPLSVNVATVSPGFLTVNKPQQGVKLF